MAKLSLHRAHRLLPISVWNDGVRGRLMQFWHGRGFTFTEIGGDYLRGTRGSTWDNLTSFDPGRLRTTLSIARPNPSEILCLLEIDTRFQFITEWNALYWDLELDTLESFLWRDDLREADWARYGRASTQANVLFSVSFGLLGNRVPPAWRDSILRKNSHGHSL